MSQDDDLLQDLEDDFGSMSDAELEESVVVDDTEQSETCTGTETEQLLRALAREYKPINLSTGALNGPKELCQLLLLQDSIKKLMLNNKFSTVTLLSELQPVIQSELALLHNYIKSLYSKKFSELDSLVNPPRSYSKLIKFLETSDARDLSTLEGILSKEQILIVSMSMKTGFKRDLALPSDERTYLLTSIDMLLQLYDLQDEITSFIASQVINIAPNVCAIVGPQVASKLLSAAGGLLELSQVPSCNLASIGKDKYMSHEINTDMSGVRQRGYVYSCSLIQDQPTHVHKQALRMVCAKVSLAARVDISNNKDNSLGVKWANEISEKLNKLQDPPNISNTKSLPIPEDKPKKKRAGRKFRKYKQQFQLSHLRQLQNRVEFGTQERTVIDSYGEEIGMGMAGSLQATQYSTHNNTAKMRKSMKRRIADAEDNVRDFVLLDDRMGVVEGNKDTPTQPSEKKSKTAGNGWYSKHISQ